MRRPGVPTHISIPAQKNQNFTTVLLKRKQGEEGKGKCTPSWTIKYLSSTILLAGPWEHLQTLVHLQSREAFQPSCHHHRMYYEASSFFRT
eukprot:766764-Hanusia_phi.AAC.6